MAKNPKPPVADPPAKPPRAKKPRSAISIAANRRGNPNGAPLHVLKPHQWKPGQSGNPSGRPRSTTEMKQRAAISTDIALGVFELTTQLAYARLQWAVDVLADPHSPPDNVALALLVATSKPGHDAAQHLLDRGHGRPQQKLEIDTATELDGLSEDELDDVIVKLAAKVVGEMKAKKHGRK